MPNPDYAELHALSPFSFQRGASSAQELFERAKALGYQALAITDECSLAGIVRAWEASKRSGLKLIVGSEFTLEDGLKVVLLALNHLGYSALCSLITRGRRAAEKGQYQLHRTDVESIDRSGLIALWVPLKLGLPRVLDSQAAWVHTQFAERSAIALSLHRQAHDRHKLECLNALSQRSEMPLVACGDVRMHARSRRSLSDVMTAIRLNGSLRDASAAFGNNGEHHLRPREDLARLYPASALAYSLNLAARCSFDLGQLRYTYPHEIVPLGSTASAHLRALTLAGAQARWPEGTSISVRTQIEHELKLIAELRYEAYFLTVHDIVQFARSRGILCQGRGSAANSAVCFCLGITEVDPSRMHMLFERFISRERNEPPDIDVDFEHERREEVIQYVYRKYGRERAAIAATVICYRPKSAIRDVGKALGLSAELLELLSQSLGWWDSHQVLKERLIEKGLDPESPELAQLIELSAQLLGFPRHLSQHVGGFVISEEPLHTLVPVENAAMPERTIIQWDKDDLDALGLLKVDCLALGMLSAIRRSFDLIHALRGKRWSLATIPSEDPETYQMIQAADTVGVFQIESRAQMSMLPRLKPRTFYDLVIEVAIVRPGPIQGKMVHPYLRRRQGLEPVDYPSEDLKQVFERTLGVPIFQEQVMQLAIVAAGFSPGEADQLRRSMAAWKRRGGMDYFQTRIVEGMRARGYSEAFAHQVFEQIRGFGSYGFPESHAASFALLVYVSAWLKRHEPVAFAAGLINAQPMGFYSADQIIQDLRRHGEAVWPIDVLSSDWECTLSNRGSDQPPALRLGLRLIRGLDQKAADRLSRARDDEPLADVHDLAWRAKLNAEEMALLAQAGALRSLIGHRRRAAWEAAGVERLPGLFEATRIADADQLPPPAEIDEIYSDYASTGLSLRRHPLALLRPKLKRFDAITAQTAKVLPHRTHARMIGLVTLRQRPSSAGGVNFLTLEDETGWVNVVIWERLAQQQRQVLTRSTLMLAEGLLESAEGVQHLIAERIENLDRMIGDLDARSRDYH
jgi:error-prone DNA polymerase